jgi:outer membrane protein OmpA-like peptidoglycan-associated protein
MSLSCNWSNKAKGTTIGASSGAAVGGVIGKKAGNTAAGIIIGAAVGGTAGYFIGRYMDRQAEEIEKDLEGVEVERVGEGILLTFDSGLLFKLNSFDVSNATESQLAELSEILNKYNDTEILLRGHTDSSGSEAYNMELSENRAKSVRNTLVQDGVDSRRFIIEGYGESMPVADNSTDAGRKQNRRVELAIYANDKLKKAAKKGDLED